MPIVKAIHKTDEAVRTIGRFQSGEIKPVSTGIEWLDKILLGGLLPSTILTLGGLSNHGKTHMLQRIENNILDVYDDVVLLRCNWESTVYKLLLRKIKEKTGAGITEILYNTPKGKTLEEIKSICNQERRDGLYYLEETTTPNEFYKAVSGFLREEGYDAQGKPKRVLVSIDHVGLVKGREKASIDGLFEMMNILKKEHPFVMFIPLIQMGREKILNRKNDIMSHQPNQTDFYGSDQLFQLSDAVVAVFNPYKIGVEGKYMKFGKHRYTYIDPQFIVDGGERWNHFLPDGNIFYHAVKSRDIEDMADFQDVWVENIFTVEKHEPQKKVRTEEDVEDILGD